MRLPIRLQFSAHTRVYILEDVLEDERHRRDGNWQHFSLASHDMQPLCARPRPDGMVWYGI